MNTGITVTQGFDNHFEQQNQILFEHKGEQVRLTISEFKGNLYLGIRVWLLDIDGEWFPTRSGFSFPYNIHTTARLYSALVSMLSNSEVLDEVILHSKELSND